MGRGTSTTGKALRGSSRSPARGRRPRRTHEAYVKAVAVSHHELSHALEASPPDNYVPEAMRRPHAVPLQ
ncbi:hypothetical protein DIPPA_23193 [Diplonema papillatum]|nr:hypothetical protein DIPPA_23193 [Diplonema papillatum]